jgi:thiol-disulfide isomerase/thioredoxin
MIRFIIGCSIILCSVMLPTHTKLKKTVQSPPQVAPAVKTEIPVQTPQPKKKTQMLYFGATWCPPCNKMKQLFKDPEVKKELDRLDFRMYDQTKDRPMFKKFNITLYPTTQFQAEGAITTRYTGYIPKKDLLEILRSVKD